MGYKVGFLLSLVFIIEIFIMTSDLMSIQFIYTNLDAVSVTAGHYISQRGGITEEVVRLVENQAGANIEPVGDVTPMFGSLFEYRIYKSYKPHFIKEDVMEIAVYRSVVIGYYS